MFLAFLVGNDASAVEDNLFEDQTVRLGYFYRPSFQEGMQDDEQKNGFGYEYLQKISYLSGWRYEYVYGTFETLFEKLKSGEIDILIVLCRRKTEKIIIFVRQKGGLIFLKILIQH